MEKIGKMYHVFCERTLNDMLKCVRFFAYSLLVPDIKLLCYVVGQSVAAPGLGIWGGGI